MILFLGDDGRLRSGWRFLISVGAFVAANWIAALFADSLARGSERLFDVLFRPAAALLSLLAYCLMLLVLDRVKGNPLRALGLGSHAALPDSFLGITVGFGMALLAVLLQAAVQRGQWGYSPDLNRHTFKLALIVLWTLVSGALAEELSFRGYPFQRLVEGLGPVGAIVVSSILFGSVHLRNPHVSLLGALNTVLIGVVLSVAYLRSRGLWLPWGIHFSWNMTLGLIFGLPVSGLTDFAVFGEGRVAGPNWLTGGNYGLEGGILATVAIGLGFLFLRRQVPQRPAPAIEIRPLFVPRIAP
ncbi:MAG TPA: CPBP family intramembrane glutamic endopeptidase [Terriglobales bacterium]|nr:CPBP family intramembrane glutamic endopeptidase [Terriglobales bacterium]